MEANAAITTEDNPFISIDPVTPVTTPKIDIDVGPGTYPVDPDVASKRTAKATYGLNGLATIPPFDEFKRTIEQGQENSLRQDVASQLDFKRSVLAQQTITQLANNNGPLDPNSLASITGPLRKPTDPGSVFEEAFSKRYIDAFYNTKDANPGNWINDAVESIPKEVQNTTELGADVVTKYQFAKRYEEEAQQLQKTQGWGPFLGNIALDLIPFRRATVLRNEGVPAVFGEQMESERQAMYNLLLDEFKTKFLEKYNRLKESDPSLAYEYAHAMAGQSIDDKVLHSMFGLLDASVVGGIAGGVGRALYKKIALYNFTQTANKDLAKSTASVTTQPVSVAVAAGIGDLGEAAVQKVNIETLSKIARNTNPEQEAIEALPSLLKLDTAKEAQNPGRFGQEIINRIKERRDNLVDETIKAITENPRVDRIAAAIKSEDTVRAIKNEVRENHPNISSNVLDIQDPYKQKAANSWFVDMIIGRNTGEFFDTLGEARGVAKVKGLYVKPEAFRLENVESKIADLRADLREGPAMEADVAELNRHANIPKALNELHIERKDILEHAGEGYAIEQHGAGFFIRVPTPVNETSPITRAGLIPLKDQVGQNSFTDWSNATIGWLRTPEDTRTLDSRMASKIATYGPSNFLDIARKNVQYIANIAPASNLISSVRRQRWDDFERLLNAGQRMIDPNNKKPGYFFQSPGEIEQHYLQHYGYLPDENVISAYFAFKDNVEFDRMLRVASIYRNKSRVGTESHRIRLVDADGNETYSPFFDAVRLGAFPGGKDESVLVIREKMGSEKVYDVGQGLNTAERRKLEKEVEDGTSIALEVWDTGSRPLQNFGKVKEVNRVRYVVARDVETKPLSWKDQLPRTGAGHLERDYDYYLKQAVMKYDPVTSTWWYEGDKTVFTGTSRAALEDIGRKMGEVQDLINVKRLTEARQLHEAHELPWSWADHLAKYRQQKTPEGVINPPQLDSTQQFRVVPRNGSIIDMDKTLEDGFKNANFKDGTRQGSLARQAQVQFTAERDAYELFAIENTGTVYNPVFAQESAKMIDPIPMMNRSTSSIINSFFMDDVKISYVEHWLQQARPYLAATDSEIHYSPFYNFQQAKYKTKVPTEIMLALEADHQKIDQFIGTPNFAQTFLFSVSQSLADSIYTNVGPKAARLTPTWLISKLVDVPQFLRTVVFHPTLGLGNIAQFFVQSISTVNVAAIAGFERASQGAAAASMHLYSTLNSSPEILAGLGRKLEKLGWGPGQFEEARAGLLRSGFKNFEGEHAALDAPLSSKIVQNMGQQVLDIGATPFRGGNRTVRVNAWYTAYKEKVDGGGGRFEWPGQSTKLTDNDWAEVLERADFLSLNMSRASSSMIQKGLLTFGAQFESYNLRLFEVLMSKRTTPAERTRLMGTYLVLYGVPSVAGFVGASTLTRKTANENFGYVVGENPVSDLLMNGLLSFMGATVTGRGDPRKGTYFNFGERYGAKDLAVVSGILDGDKTFQDVFGGAVLSNFSNYAESTSGFRRALGSMIRRDGQFPMTGDDLFEMAKQIASISAFHRQMVAANLGKWVSKKDLPISDVTWQKALFMNIAGVQDQRDADLHWQSLIMKDRKSTETEAFKEFSIERRRALISLNNGDKEDANIHFNKSLNILALYGYPEHKVLKAIQLADRSNTDLLRNNMMWEIYTKDVPAATKKGLLPQLGPVEKLDQLHRTMRVGN